jgi:hypothetical protein
MKTMPIDITMNDKNTHLEIQSTGRLSNLEEVKDYSDTISALAKKMNHTHILCDERRVKYKLSLIETVKLAEHISKSANHSIRLALVQEKNKPEASDFFQIVSRNRGIHIKVTSDKKEAEQWLTK